MNPVPDGRYASWGGACKFRMLVGFSDVCSIALLSRDNPARDFIAPQVQNPVEERRRHIDDCFLRRGK